MSHYFDDPSLFRNQVEMKLDVMADDYIDPLLGAKATVAILRDENSRLRKGEGSLQLRAAIYEAAYEFVCDWFTEGESSCGTLSSRRSKIYKMANGRCFYCGLRLGSEWHIEHMIPLSRGGDSSTDNLCPSCKNCNMKKSDSTSEEFRRLLAKKVGRPIVFFGESMACNGQIRYISLCAATVQVARNLRLRD